MKHTSLSLIFSLAFMSNVFAANYVIDDSTNGSHAFINFKIKHLGYSWLTGRFNKFSGKFEYDPEDPNASSISVTIDPASIDSNHAERDKHLRGKDFLNVDQFNEAKFVSTKITDKGNGKLEVIGDFTLKGITKSITIDGEKIGEGKDPWGGYRTGFTGNVEFALKDFGIDYDLGPASRTVKIYLHLEGIKK